jgi:hypothetical protein
MDVKTAFLYGLVNEEIYVQQPEGFDDGSGRACKLLRALYGLKQVQGCRQGQLRTKAPEWSPHTEVSGNEEKKRKRPKVRSQTTFGCRISDVAI